MRDNRLQRAITRACWTVTLIPVMAACAHAAPAPCDALRGVQLPNTSIVAVTLVDSGKFVPPQAVRQPTAFRTLPAFCRVEAVARPSTDSDIAIEVWLPVAGWNRRYVGVGNGSFGGSINYPRLGEALRSGYATSSTDTGHRGAPTDDTWATDHPEKQADFDYRAIHETAQMSKAMVRALYGSDPGHSYFNSCSNGGRQGLMEAERYPADYDGIMAGAPATSFGFRTFVTGDFRAFQQRNGKIIIYHGGADAPEPNVRFFSKLRAQLGDSTVSSFLQLYLVPGMGHCGGGPEPSEIGQSLRPGDDPEHSLFKALEQWVEDGVPPAGVTAVKFAVAGNPASGVVQTRKLYPYPRPAEKNQ
jgi:tannase/feruloyl esterase